VGNAISIIRYADIKRIYVDDVYRNLRNAIIAFYNIGNAESEEDIRRNWAVIKTICVSLDTRLNDTMTVFEPRVSFSFEDYAEHIKWFFMESHDEDDVDQFVEDNMENLLKLAKQLSVNYEQGNNGLFLSGEPNYSVKPRQIVEMMNNFLDDRAEFFIKINSIY
jgi:hypothetical protein